MGVKKAWEKKDKDEEEEEEEEEKETNTEIQKHEPPPLLDKCQNQQGQKALKSSKKIMAF